MTWDFGYLLVMLTGLVLAVAAGTLRKLPFLPAHRHLVVPRSEQRASALSRLEGRLGIALAAAGAVGLAVDRFASFTAAAELGLSTAAGLVAGLLAVVLGRRACEPGMSGEVATVVRAIGPRGFGQVRLGPESGGTVVAARSEDDEPIPEGAVVEVVDCSHSVLIVRRAATAP